MFITGAIEEAPARLKELVHELAPGDEIIITEQHKAIARLRSEAELIVRRPPPGLGKGSILYMAPDFDEPLDEMKGEPKRVQIVRKNGRSLPGGYDRV